MAWVGFWGLVLCLPACIITDSSSSAVTPSDGVYLGYIIGENGETIEAEFILEESFLSVFPLISGAQDRTPALSLSIAPFRSYPQVQEIETATGQTNLGIITETLLIIGGTFEIFLRETGEFVPAYYFVGMTRRAVENLYSYPPPTTPIDEAYERHIGFHFSPGIIHLAPWLIDDIFMSSDQRFFEHHYVPTTPSSLSHFVNGHQVFSTLSYSLSAQWFYTSATPHSVVLHTTGDPDSPPLFGGSLVPNRWAQLVSAGYNYWLIPYNSLSGNQSTKGITSGRYLGIGMMRSNNISPIVDLVELAVSSSKLDYISRYQDPLGFSGTYTSSFTPEGLQNDYAYFYGKRNPSFNAPSGLMSIPLFTGRLLFIAIDAAVPSQGSSPSNLSFYALAYREGNLF